MSRKNSTGKRKILYIICSSLLLGFINPMQSNIIIINTRQQEHINFQPCSKTVCTE